MLVTGRPEKIPILIIGAGPTGLVLALCLQRLGMPFRIVDKAAGPGSASRALVVQARTLEFYRQLGIADAVLAAGQRFIAVNLWARGRRRGRVAFGDIGRGLSPFPYSLILPQDEHEKVLLRLLQERGVSVEWETEVVALEQTADAVTTTLRRPDGVTTQYTSAYVAGCDGVHSVVRGAFGIDFPGGTYSHVWYVADVEATGPLVNEEVNISMDRRDVLAVFPMPGTGNVRLVGQAVADVGASTWDDVDQRLLRELRTQVTTVRWFSTYRVHHRVARTFRNGRAFLLGDAAHVHSPVGGQGMNTGIGDAVNLGWKLAAALSYDPRGRLLETYEPERIAFARRLVATTDRVFTLLSSGGAAAQFARAIVLPAVVPLVTRAVAGRELVFRLLSQISITYRGGPLAEGRAGRIRSGDRLPWVALAEGRDNFTALASLTWQVHVYGTASPALRSFCEESATPLHVFPWLAAMRGTGLTRNALYLVRPDGHVGYASERADVDGLRRFVTSYRFRNLK